MGKDLTLTAGDGHKLGAYPKSQRCLPVQRPVDVEDNKTYRRPIERCGLTQS